MKKTKFLNFIEKLENNMVNNNEESLILTNFSEQQYGGLIGVNDSRCVNGSSACNGSINDSRCSNGSCDNSINGRKCTVISPS